MDLETAIDLVERGDHHALAAALRADPTLASSRTDEGDTLLHIACWQKRAAIVRELLAYAPDLDARGAYGRTPLHYAVHEGGVQSVPIAAALLARGADPSIADDNGFTVGAWAEIEMVAGLPELRALLDSPPPITTADLSLASWADRDAREPTEREVSFRIGRTDHFVEVKVLRGRDATAGAHATSVCVTVAFPDRAGGSACASCFPSLGAVELARFGAALATMRARRSGSATLDLPDAYGLHLEVSASATGFRASYALATVVGPPGAIDQGAKRSDGRPTPGERRDTRVVRRCRDAVAQRSDPCDRPPRLEVELDDAGLDELVQRIDQARAALEAWSAADAGA